MRSIVSWNVNSVRARLDHVRRWIADAAPDVIALQETKTSDENFPRAELEALGYRLTISGQPAYNGVAVLSREAPRSVTTAIPDLKDEQRRVLGVEFADFYLLNLYVPNGAAVGSDKYYYKLAWLDALRAWLEVLCSRCAALVIVGDFNIAPEDRDVHDPEAWRGQILCSDAERVRLKQLCALGLVDTFRLFEQAAGHFSWWDYRAGAFRRNHGLRIDLILASAALASRCTAAHIDPAPRAWDKPSDHVPVAAAFDL